MQINLIKVSLKPMLFHDLSTAKKKGDENQQAPLKDPLHIPVEPKSSDTK